MNLPDEIVLNIFRYISIFEVKAIIFTCKKFKNLIKEIKFKNEIKDIFESKFNFDELKLYLNNYTLNMYICYINMIYRDWNRMNYLTFPYGPLNENSAKYKSINVHNSFLHRLAVFVHQNTKNHTKKYMKILEKIQKHIFKI